MVDDNVRYENVESSNLYAVGYDPENGNLFIIFKIKATGAPGRKWVYYNVPAHVFSELMAAESKGKYHAAHIKKVYGGDELSAG